MNGTRQPEQGTRSAGRRYTVPVLIAATAVFAASMIRDGIETPSGPPRPAMADAPSETPVAAPGARPKGPAGPAALAFATPVKVRIPVMGVNAPLIAVGLDKHGGVDAPPPHYKNLAGWFSKGAAPGQKGTAVIDGHVDNIHGRTVFYGLGTLHKGNEIEVARADGRTAVFTVYGVTLFAKNDFPAERVYHDTGQPELRVITCGGGFTKKTGYDSDVVVFARLSGVRPTAATATPTPSATPAG